MKDSTYWEKRVANKTWDIYNSLEERNKALIDIYKEASLDIEEELFQIAKKIKTSNPTLSDMHRYNRLGKLKDNISNTLNKLANEVEKRTTKQITQAFIQNYSNTMKELGTSEYSLPNKKLIESLLKFPWSGENFSNRLWENTRVLERNLNEIMTRGLVQGKTIVEMAIELDSRMIKGFNEAHRLVRTETMHYLNESSLRAYTDSKVKEIQLWAAVDERTCPVCGVKHGNIYNIKDAPVLPLHANCRCTYIPIVHVLDNDKDYIINDKIEFTDATDIKGAEEWAIYNLKLKNVSYKGIDVNVANYINKSLNDIYNEYPLLSGFVQDIKTDGRASAPASAVLSFKEGKLNTKLNLSKKDLSNLESIDEMIKRCVDDKWWTPKDGIKGVIQHEMGHMIEYATILKKYGVINANKELDDLSKLRIAFNGIKSGELSKEVKMNALSNLKIVNTKKNVKENLSDYSNHSTLEFLAEAVSEHDPRPLAKETVRLLKEKIKEIWE